ncbi:MAG: hypothetical protein R3A47_07015, partial [Polyangiales bacterium]
LHTGSAFTTGQRDRERLATISEGLAALNIPVAWSAQGLWEHESGARFAQQIGLIWASDPLTSGFENGTNAYTLFSSQARKRGLSEADNFVIADAAKNSDCESIYIAVDTPQAHRDAVNLQTMLRQVI